MSDESVPQPRTDFVSCSTCGAIYAAYRSAVCPHPIQQIPISRQIAVQGIYAEKDQGGYPLAIGDRSGVVAGTAIAIIPPAPRQKKPKSPPAVHVLAPKYYQRQSWEKIGQGGKRWAAFSYWMSLADGLQTYAKVGRDLGYSAPNVIEQWAKQDQWPLRREAYLNDQAKAERKALEKAWKRRANQVLVMGDSILNILAAEADALMSNLKDNAGSMSVKELNDAYISLGKFFELLQGRATEHVTHDTPEMKRQEHLRSTAEQIHLLIEDDRKSGIDEETIAERQREYIRLGAIRFKLPEDLIAIAITSIDRVDQQSDSVS